MATYEITIPEDLTGADLEELEVQLRVTIPTLVEVYERVQLLRQSAQKVVEAQLEYHKAAEGAEPKEPPARGDVDLTQWYPWRQPAGVHDAFPMGWVTRHNGNLWRSTRPNNVWEPGTADAGWEDATPGPGEPLPPAPDAVEYVDWQPWTHFRDGTDGSVDENGDLVGRDYVLFNNTIYGCVQSHRSQPDWAPDVTPALWVLVGELPEEEVPEQPEPGVEPDPETGAPDWPAWDATTAYQRGDETVMVVHAGRLWELIHTNSDPGWEPGTLPSVWADRGPIDNN